ncbi:MAG: DUF192 domain-containing protein [Spirochaetes bacterium]|nr:DUF192 domain-containing protein [Spirochaetota bacterium]
MKSKAQPGMVAALAALLLFCFSCSRGSSAQITDKPNAQLKTVTLKSGSVQVQVEVARTEIERNRGLMFRKDLKAGKGMLFDFAADQRVSFWMKNTSIPLSVAYLGSDGSILQILDLRPFSEEPRPSERSVRYALEVPQSWFTQVGLKEGDKFDIPKLP